MYLKLSAYYRITQDACDCDMSQIFVGMAIFAFNFHWKKKIEMMI